MKFVTIDKMQSEVCRCLWRWYQERARPSGNAGDWPLRNSFRPEDLPARVLPHLGVVDVERDPFRVYYRLVGSNIAASLGRSHLQGYLDEMDLPQEAELVALYRQSIEANRPLLLAGVQTIDGQAFTYEGGALPLGKPDDPVRRFIIFEDYLQTEAWRSALQRRSYRPVPDSDC